MRIDKRRHYILMVDTETANTLETEKGKLDMSCVLPYDCGWAVVDTRGNIYCKRSYVNRDIFVYERELMQSAYYAKKIPQYVEDIQAGNRIMASTYEIRKQMLEDMELYGITEVCAHNAKFDYTALNNAQKWATKSAFRYWFPFGTVFWDTMTMAKSVMGEMPTYRKFCEENGLMTKNGRPRFTAEACYRFIANDPYFEESHTGLEDVLIESAIMVYCINQHKPMKKLLWEPKEFPERTSFQANYWNNLKEIPTINMGAVFAPTDEEIENFFENF